MKFHFPKLIVIIMITIMPRHAMGKKNDLEFEYFFMYCLFTFSYARIVKVNRHVKFPSQSFRRKGKGQ